MAREKGIKIISTGDFTHPKWISEIKNKLKDNGGGFYSLKGGSEGTRFVLGSEVCTIFEDRQGKSRRIHHCILAPSIEVVEQINGHLSAFGELASDGRPALNKMTPGALVEDLLSIDREVFVYPAHLWTPWFGALGAFSGFNSIEEAYQDQAKHVYAYETGLSSDPPMNWRIAKLDKYTLLSGSDAHSLPKMGREAIVLDMEEKEMNFAGLIGKIKRKELKLTVEFYPEEGKYHFDGHRNCNVFSPPDASKRYGNICPKCGKRLTIGVLHRVDDLADREEGYVPKGACLRARDTAAGGHSHVTKKSQDSSCALMGVDAMLVQKFGTEMNVLMNPTLTR